MVALGWHACTNACGVNPMHCDLSAPAPAGPHCPTRLGLGMGHHRGDTVTGLGLGMGDHHRRCQRQHCLQRQIWTTACLRSLDKLLVCWGSRLRGEPIARRFQNLVWRNVVGFRGSGGHSMLTQAWQAAGGVVYHSDSGGNLACNEWSGFHKGWIRGNQEESVGGPISRK